MGRKKKRRFQRMKNLQRKVNKTLTKISKLKENKMGITIMGNQGLSKNRQQTISNPRDDAWEVKLDMVSACSKAPETILVLINPLAKTKIDLLMEKYKSKEWLAYLVGENNVVFDIVIPDQIASGASVTDVDFPNENNLPIIGVIHSHHNMAAGFSGTDDEWINQNHNISIVISHTGMKGQVRWKSPCGAMKIVPATIRLNIQVDYDKKAFLKEASEKIKTRCIFNSTDTTGRKVIVRSKYEPGKIKVETEEVRYNPTKICHEKIVYIDWVDPADAGVQAYGQVFTPPNEDPDWEDLDSESNPPDPETDEIEQIIDDWDKGDINPDEWDTTIDPDDISLEDALDDIEAKKTQTVCFGEYEATSEDCQICSLELECKAEETGKEEISPKKEAESPPASGNPRISYTKLPKELNLALRTPFSFKLVQPDGYSVDSKGFLKGPHGFVKLLNEFDVPSGYFLDKNNYLKIKPEEETEKAESTEEIVGTSPVNVEDLPEGYYRDTKGCLRGPDGKFVRKNDIIANA